jgi:hypothetical protein
MSRYTAIVPRVNSDQWTPTRRDGAPLVPRESHPPMTGPREGLDEGGLRSNSLPWTLDEWLIWDCVEVSICLVINISNQKYGK